MSQENENILHRNRCRLKHDFFCEWPEEMTSHGEATFQLADCNMMDKYADLLNMIFNVRFVERVVELKALIDAQILCMHVHPQILQPPVVSSWIGCTGWAATNDND